jgi:NAD+ kinase
MSPLPPVRRLGLVLHPDHDADHLVDQVRAWAAEHDVALCGLRRQAALLPDALRLHEAGDLGAHADVVLAMGGDGTLLGALREVAAHRTPVLGVATGRVSFLAEVPADELEAALDDLAAGRAEMEELLGVEADIGVGEGDALAFNEVVLARRRGRGPLELDVVVDGALFVRYAADGLLVATPTGSTAYNLAAGGPILSPRVAGLAVAPVAPQGTLDRAVVLSAAEDLRVDVRAPATVEADGRLVAELDEPRSVELRPRPGAARLVRRRDWSFYRHARRQVLLADSPRVTPRMAPQD